MLPNWDTGKDPPPEMEKRFLKSDSCALNLTVEHSSAANDAAKKTLEGQIAKLKDGKDVN